MVYWESKVNYEIGNQETQEQMAEWHRLVEQDGIVRVEFVTSAERYWRPEVMVERPVQMGNVQGKEVVLGGKGALWMYMHGAAKAWRGGAREIVVEQMPGPALIRVYPRGGVRRSGGEEWYRRSETDTGEVVLWFVERATGRWDESVLDTIGAGLDDVKGKNVYITGVAANWMAAGMTVAALRGGAEAVWYYSPMLSVDEAAHIVKGRTEEMPESVLRSLRLERPGIIAGVVGDPNSGKSVFARLLQYELRRMKKDCWLLDCDAGSPTAPWYLLAKGTAYERDAAEERRRQKVPWTEALEETMAMHLKNVRWHEEVTIADLPGGRYDAARGVRERIPPHREVMLREVDAFIVVTRDGMAIAEAWRKELEKHGLEKRIVAVMESRQPDGELKGEVWRGADGVVTGWMEGLRREVLAQQPVPEVHVVREMWEMIAEMK